MAEELTLTAPIAVTGYRVTYLSMDWPSAKIIIIVHDVVSNKPIKHEYTGTTATNLMVALNKVNLSTSSLQKRILERLVSDGMLPAGTVTGTPD